MVSVDYLESVNKLKDELYGSEVRLIEAQRNLEKLLQERRELNARSNVQQPSIDYEERNKNILADFEMRYEMMRRQQSEISTDRLNYLKKLFYEEHFKPGGRGDDGGDDDEEDAAAQVEPDDDDFQKTTVSLTMADFSPKHHKNAKQLVSPTSITNVTSDDASPSSKPISMATASTTAPTNAHATRTVSGGGGDPTISSPAGIVSIGKKEPNARSAKPAHSKPQVSFQLTKHQANSKKFNDDNDDDGGGNDNGDGQNSERSSRSESKQSPKHSLSPKQQKIQDKLVKGDRQGDDDVQHAEEELRKRSVSPRLKESRQRILRDLSPQVTPRVRDSRDRMSTGTMSPQPMLAEDVNGSTSSLQMTGRNYSEDEEKKDFENAEELENFDQTMSLQQSVRDSSDSQKDGVPNPNKWPCEISGSALFYLLESIGREAVENPASVKKLYNFGDVPAKSVTSEIIKCANGRQDVSHLNLSNLCSFVMQQLTLLSLKYTAPNDRGLLSDRMIRVGTASLEREEQLHQQMHSSRSAKTATGSHTQQSNVEKHHLRIFREICESVKFAENRKIIRRLFAHCQQLIAEAAVSERDLARRMSACLSDPTKSNDSAHTVKMEQFLIKLFDLIKRDLGVDNLDVSLIKTLNNTGASSASSSTTWHASSPKSTVSVVQKPSEGNEKNTGKNNKSEPDSTMYQAEDEDEENDEDNEDDNEDEEDEDDEEFEDELSSMQESETIPSSSAPSSPSKKPVTPLIKPRSLTESAAKATLKEPTNSVMPQKLQNLLDENDDNDNDDDENDELEMAFQSKSLSSPQFTSAGVTEMPIESARTPTNQSASTHQLIKNILTEDNDLANAANISLGTKSTAAKKDNDFDEFSEFYQ